jgi:hypothetical protein
MKKLLIGLIAGLTIFASALFAANDHYVVGNASAVTNTWTEFVIDTFSVTENQPATEWTFKRLYNVQITTINPAACSTGVAVWTEDGIFGFENTPSVARTYSKVTLGLNSEADTLSYYMGINNLWMEGVLGDSGAVDTFCLIELRGVR